MHGGDVWSGFRLVAPPVAAPAKKSGCAGVWKVSQNKQTLFFFQKSPTFSSQGFVMS